MENWNDYNYCLEAVKRNGYNIKYVKEQTKEMCLEAVKQNGYNIKYVKEQTNELCLEAVKQNGKALYYVKEQTKEICLEAVKEYGYALQYVKEQTPELIHLMRKNNIVIIEDCVKVTQEQMDEYYEQNPHLLLTL